MALVVLMNLMAPMALVNQAGLVAHTALVALIAQEALNHQIHQIQISAQFTRCSKVAA